jgi:iron(III) transport system ATP-binding protein
VSGAFPSASRSFPSPSRGEPATEEGLSLEGVAKSFGGREVLRNVDLVVPTGELTAILGASGSGKTTILRLVAGFEEPDRGRVSIGGRTVSGGGRTIPPERRSVGYVAQEGALFPHLSVAENVGFGLPRTERESSRRIDEVLEMVGLKSSFKERRPHQLSGGEQRRVALARALAPAPAAIVLDEPFSGLDAGLRGETRRAVAEALAQAGTTALLVTHDQAEALSIGHQVGVLCDGRLAQVAHPEVLYRRPVDAEVARLVGEAVLLGGSASGGVATCALGRIAAAGAASGQVLVLLRPEQLRLVPAAESTGTPVARVRSVEYFGPHATVWLLLDDGSEVMARVSGHAAPSPGEEVRVAVEGEAVVFPAG